MIFWGMNFDLKMLGHVAMGAWVWSVVGFLLHLRVGRCCAWVAWVAWVAATPSVVGTHRAVARGIPEAVGDTACAPDVIVDAAEHAACCVPGDA